MSSENIKTRVYLDGLEMAQVPTDIHQLANHFDRVLPENWDIFIQPYFNGLQPDLVLIHSDLGIYIIECKPEISVALSRLKLIQEGVKQLYCPRAFLDQKKTRIKPGIFYGLADISREHEEIISDIGDGDSRIDNFSVISNKFSKQDFKEIFSLDSNNSFAFNPHYAEDLRAWLRCSDYKISASTPLPQLDSRQTELVNRSTPKFLKICGSAGSGKTMILAAKAAKFISEGKSILILTYNITLVNYIRNLIHQNLEEHFSDQAQKSFRYSISWFHRFAKTNLVNLGWEQDYSELFTRPYSVTDVLDNKLPALLKKLSDDEGVPEYLKFDAILIDEGQDFLPNWWESVRPFLINNGNACFVYDFRQDVYNRVGEWRKKNFSLSGFIGRPNELKLAYRMPNAYIPKIKGFINMFMLDQNNDGGEFEDLVYNLPEPAKQIDILEQCNTSWIQVENESDADKKCIEAILDHSKLEVDDFAYSSLLFLTTSKKAGIRICKELSNKDISVTDTFDNDADSERGKKTSFNLHNDPIKATHVFSGKGLESSQIVLQVTDNAKKSDVYTGLTRLKMGANSQCSIIVVCSNPKFKEFGNFFNNS